MFNLRLKNDCSARVKKMMLGAGSLIVLNTVAFNSSPVFAQNAPQNVKQEKLKALAADFLKRVKEKDSPRVNARESNEMGQISANKNTVSAPDINKQDYSQIPDGQDLLLRPRVGMQVYQYDIYALKKNNSIYFALNDVIDILELAIDFDSETQKGEGWFLREDWRIDIDLDENQVRSRGNKITVSEADFFEQDGDVFVSQDALGQWLGMTFVSDVSQQYLEIDSPYPLPTIARNYRQQKNAGRRGGRAPAELPRKKTTYDWLDINTADVRVGTTYRKFDDAPSTQLSTAGIAVQGQALRHEAYLQASGDDRDGVNGVRARLSKRDEDAVLLGALKARSYTIGDTDITDIPLTGDARQELGFRASNSTLTRTEFQTTDINGDALPNWDVELYRNGILVGSELIGADGRYEFSDVQLFAGDNTFEIFFYGPQGEIRNQKINVPVTAELLSSQNNTYDISASLSESQTYNRRRSDDPDEYKPHFAARFNKVFGNTLTYAGVRNRNVEGDNKTFVGAGATRVVGGAIIDLNAGIDDEANTAAQLIARKNIDDWNLSLSGKVQDEEYQPDETSDPRILEAAANIQRRFRFTPRTNSNLLMQGEYGELASGTKATSGRLGLSHQFGRYNLSNTTFYESFDSDESSDDFDERLDNTLSLRANLGRVFMRGGVNYDIKPQAQVDEYFSQITYRPTAKFSSDFYLDHEPDRDFTEGRLNLNYTHKNFRTSPFIEVDSDKEVFAGVNVNFNVIDTPNRILPDISSNRTVGRSMVSAFVYHDKNGNLIYDAQDEPLPDVTVESLNVRRRAQTDDSGYSLIKDISGNRATDIDIDIETLPDSFMVPAVDGVSIIPSAGEITEINFPVHLAGEVDGTVGIIKQDGTRKLAKGGEVLFYPLHQQMQRDKVKPVADKTFEPHRAQIAFDGFYIATRIPPGQYLMTVSDKTTKAFNVATPQPQMISIGFNGDTVYGRDITLNEGRGSFPINVNYTAPPFDKIEGEFKPVSYTLKVGAQEKSKLKRMVSMLAMKKLPTSVFDNLTQLNRPDNYSKEVRYFKAAHNDMDTLYQRCKIMREYGVACAIDVWVHYTAPKSGPFIPTATRRIIQEAAADRAPTPLISDVNKG